MFLYIRICKLHYQKLCSCYFWQEVLGSPLFKTILILMEEIMNHQNIKKRNIIAQIIYNLKHDYESKKNWEMKMNTPIKFTIVSDGHDTKQKL